MNPLLEQGIELMLVGMGVVMVFLLGLVGVVRVMSALVARLAPDAVPAASPAAAPAAAPAAVDARTLAVIREAIRHHRGQS